MGQFSTTDIENSVKGNELAKALQLVYGITFEDQMGLSEVIMFKNGEMAEYDDLSKREQKLLGELAEHVERDMADEDED